MVRTAPDELDQLLAQKDPSRVLRQRRQQPELEGVKDTVSSRTVTERAAKWIQTVPSSYSSFAAVFSPARRSTASIRADSSAGLNGLPT